MSIKVKGKKSVSYRCKEYVVKNHMTAVTPREHLVFLAPDQDHLTLDQRQEHTWPDIQHAWSRTFCVWSKTTIHLIKDPLRLIKEAGEFDQRFSALDQRHSTLDQRLRYTWSKILHTWSKPGGIWSKIKCIRSRTYSVLVSVEWSGILRGNVDYQI